jgi:Holliday junction resolvase RusA-like endonuclease
MAIKVNVTPLAKPRMTRRDKWAKRPVVTAYRAYGDELRLKLPGYTLPEALYVTFYLPMPISWSERKKVRMEGMPHKQRPDIDNLLKGVMDHLATEDCYIWKVNQCKLWAREGAIEIGAL